MLFSSIPFLYYFLPLVLLCYFAVPKALKNIVLLLFSLAFYAWGEPMYVFLMMATIAVNYILGLLIEKFRGRTLSKIFVTLSVTLSLAVLGYFKYADFFIENFNAVTGLSVNLLNIALPIGISFYTFQILSYTVDVYRGTVKAQKNPITLGAYISLFPQLIAGPIVRYSDVEKQLNERTHSFDKFSLGVRRFIFGLSKKIIIANTLGELCETFHGADDKSVLFYWLFVIAYMLQIYFDFSGYSDMAIGLGLIFGFHFLENFNYPLIANSITDFWRRWHISLSSFFRDYVYIPLGGNRCSKLKWIRNILIVWFLTGFWHGASWNFIIWGLYFGIILLIEKLFLKKYLDKTKVINHIYTLFIVVISFLIFSVDGKEIIPELKNIFMISDIPFISSETIYYLKSYMVILIIAGISATPLCNNLINKLKQTKLKKVIGLIEPIYYLVLLTLVTAYLIDSSFNPFLYFRF